MCDGNWKTRYGPTIVTITGSVFAHAYPTSGYILHRINSGSYEHVQSVGRLAGIGNNEYMVFTHSTASTDSGKQGALAVVRMGANQWTSGYMFGGMPNGSGSDQNTSNRTVARTYSRNNHPGGLSVLGHNVFVAQWCQPHPKGGFPYPYPYYAWCTDQPSNARNGFSVYDVSNVGQNATINSNPPIERYYYDVRSEYWYGSPATNWGGTPGTRSTAGIAAVKLSNGMYLAGLSRSGGRRYGFYTGPSITGPYTFQNAANIDKWGETGNIVTECGTGICIFSRWKDTKAA